MTVAKGYTNFNWQWRMLKQQTDCCGIITTVPPLVTVCYCSIFNFTFNPDTELISIELTDDNGNPVVIPFAPQLNFWDLDFITDVASAVSAVVGVTVDVTLIHVNPTRWALCINGLPDGYVVDGVNYDYGGVILKQTAVLRNDCDSAPRSGPLVLEFNSIFDEPFVSMTDFNDVTEWNTFLGNVFTGVFVSAPNPFSGEVIVELYGGITQGVNLLASSFSGFLGGNAFNNINVVRDQYRLIASIDVDCFAGSVIRYFESDNLPAIPNGAFQSSNIQECYAYAATSIGDYTFASSGLITYNIPAVTIGTGAFFECYGLTSIVFPAAVTVGDQAFGLLNPWPSMSYIDLSSCTSLGSTSGDNGVFLNIQGANIVVAVFNSVLATNNGGNPDGDIQYLEDPLNGNTITITYV